jgi:hypothetical protein
MHNLGLYKNYVSSYYTIAIENLYASTQKFRTDAIRIYQGIDRAINTKIESMTKTFPFYIDANDYKDWTGKYKYSYLGKDYSMEIIIEDGTLFYVGNSKNEMHPLTATKFYLDGYSIFYSFITDENNRITGLFFRRGQLINTWDKIE